MPRPVTQRWARFGPRDPRWFAHIPTEGVCISAFVFVRNRSQEVLLGRPRPHRNWPEKGCVPLWRLLEVAGHGEWTIPASHFLMEEDPEAAARRVADVWAGLPKMQPSLVTVSSERMAAGGATRRGRKNPPRNHWALCFLYELRTDMAPERRPGWSELRFFTLREARATPIGRGHGDLLRKYLGVIGE